MGSIISYEEACNIPVVWDHLDVKNMQIFKDASENGSCSIIKSTSTNPVGINIFVKYDLGVKDKIGFIQLPQSFKTPDIFQYRFKLWNQLPIEQDYFYHVIQIAKIIIEGKNFK